MAGRLHQFRSRSRPARAHRAHEQTVACRCYRIDEVPPVGREGDVAADAAQRQRCCAGKRNGRSRDARWRGLVPRRPEHKHEAPVPLRARPTTAHGSARTHAAFCIGRLIVLASPLDASASSISSRASAASASRRLRSFSRQRRSRRRIGAGVLAGSAVQSGSFVKMCASVSATSSPLNARRPVTIS